MVPFERLALERDRAETNEDHQRNHLLDHLELDQAERAAILAETDPVGGYLKAVLEKGQEPAEEDHADQGQVLKPAELLFHLQMAVPGACHEDVRDDKH